jgi:hypothetical protein
MLRRNAGCPITRVNSSCAALNQIAGALRISKGVVAKYVARVERAEVEPGVLMSMSDAEVMERFAPARKRKEGSPESRGR